MFDMRSRAAPAACFTRIRVLQLQQWHAHAHDPTAYQLACNANPSEHEAQENEDGETSDSLPHHV